MNVIEALQSRYSVRAFNAEPVSRQTVSKILEAANRTPSWANSQSWEVYLAGGQALERIRQAYLFNYRSGVPGRPDFPSITKYPDFIQMRINTLLSARQDFLGFKREDIAARQKLAEANYSFFNAPLVTYLCLDRSLSTYSIFDIGMFAQSMMLAAQHYGVGSIPAYILSIYPDIIRAELGIPENISILLGIALGYPDSANPVNKFRSPRRPLDEMSHFKDLLEEP